MSVVPCCRRRPHRHSARGAWPFVFAFFRVQTFAHTPRAPLALYCTDLLLLPLLQQIAPYSFTTASYNRIRVGRGYVRAASTSSSSSTSSHNAGIKLTKKSVRTHTHNRAQSHSEKESETKQRSARVQQHHPLFYDITLIRYVVIASSYIAVIYSVRLDGHAECRRCSLAVNGSRATLRVRYLTTFMRTSVAWRADRVLGAFVLTRRNATVCVCSKYRYFGNARECDILGCRKRAVFLGSAGARCNIQRIVVDGVAFQICVPGTVEVENDTSLYAKNSVAYYIVSELIS